VPVPERDANGYPVLPPRPTLPKLRVVSQECRGCHLWKLGTQTVFGEGPRAARILFVGEQPGDKEDLAGRPFVGPAGRLFDEALVSAGIDRSSVYVTNAVKHFKWRPSGKRRLHEKPNAAEVAACSFWLELELRLVKPDLIVALGATAAQALLGQAFRITRDGGRVLDSPSGHVLATAHPSSILRAPDEAARREGARRLVADLKTAARALRS